MWIGDVPFGLSVKVGAQPSWWPLLELYRSHGGGFADSYVLAELYRACCINNMPAMPPSATSTHCLEGTL